MKNFFSKYWKNVIFVITGLATVISIICIFITPNSIVSNFIKYGPEPEHKITEIIPQVTSGDVVETTSGLGETLSSYTGMPQTLSVAIIGFGIFVVCVLLLQNAMDSGSSAKKK